MKLMNGLFKATVMLITAVTLFSCVGTVKDADPKQSNILGTGSEAPAISFDGLIKAEAVAHDKVELQFSPADGSEDIIYEIFVNNSPIPIKVNGKSLSLNASGNYNFTITGLAMNSTYSFNIRATVAGFSSDTKLDPSKSLFATTFNNQTADFLGVSSLQLGAGEAGRDTVIVNWNPATITGTSINPKDSDPVQYEITYISQLGGPANLNNENYSGPDRRVVYSPTTLNTPPALNKEKSFPITGLSPGVTYYVQVRSIHKGFITYNSDPLYKREKNTKFLRITTFSSAGVFDFDTAQVIMTHPLGQDGLTNLDVAWLPATGEFNHYRLCYKKVAAPDGTPPATDLLTDADIDAVLNNAAFCQVLPASTTSKRLASLESYAYYQAKVLACKTATCAQSDRIRSALMADRVITNITQFSGIVKVFNPNDDQKLNEIKLSFDAPLVSSGYITKMKFYCYNSPTDPSPVLLPTDGTYSAATGKAACNGIATNTAFPASLSEFSEFTTVNVQLQTPIDGTRSYCLSLVPVIESAHLNQENLASAVVKCFTPEIKTPNIIEFPGKNPLCSTSSGKDLSITWPSPTGGLYSKFVVFYKEKSTGNDFFSFADAVSAYTANNAASPYKWVDDIDKALITSTINNLIPGKSYSIGVLPYLVNGASKVYGQYNLNVDDCSLPLPSGSFNEWVDIFAIGPKEDGLTPPTSSGYRRYLLETLDDDGIPVEMKIMTDEKTPDIAHTLTSQRTSSSTFDGVYGAWDGKDTNPLNQYSNSGIVKIAWKDISFFAGTAKMWDYISNPALEPTPNTKNSRKYGYKVYRSEDNKTSWVDLTSVSTKNKFQSTLNAGLIHPKTFTWRPRNNAAGVTERIAFFTDYSVKFSGINGEIDRARTYWYKIVPVFDGKEITWDNGTNPSHHVIRVTLPPRNMALIHRMMANRTLCLEMNKTLNKADGDNYSCDYNGLGASGKTASATIGNTVYDLGGDLLVDRFELSCPFTRGDSNFANSDSEFGGLRRNFKGLSSFGNNFKGCFNETDNYEPNRGTFTPSANYKSNQVMPGDCFGNERGTAVSIANVACADPTRVSTGIYIYPGIDNTDETANCSDSDQLGVNKFDMMNPLSDINTSDNYFFPTQSEFAAVYYMRGQNNSNNANYSPKRIPAANGAWLENKVTWDYPGNCQVNLPYVNTSGEYRPRWISVGSLFNKIGLNTGGATTLSLNNKTISQILADPNLYDGTSIKAPAAELVTSNRYNASTSLIRVATSNAAKLPGLIGMGQGDFNKTCEAYKVQVGVETASKGFVATESVQSKRLLRKKEFIAAGAWPQHYDSAKVNQLEQGLFTEDTYYKGCNGTTRLRAPAATIDGDNSAERGSTITPNFATSTKVRTFLTQGSSAHDSLNENTEKCVSKFGVQDIVGNLKEVASEEIFCDFTQDQFFLGVPNSVVNSIPYISTTWFDPNNLTPWVQVQPKSGSCSVVEDGADRTGTYVIGSTFNPIFNYSGVNTDVIKRTKRFDQEAVNSSRNGDGTFLDFGQLNMGPKLDTANSLSMTAANMSNFFNPVLGMPLVCGTGCDSTASDNTEFTADSLAVAKGYDTTNNPLNITMLDFPVNNAAVTNAGISDISQYESIDPEYPDYGPINYITGINLGGDAADPADNFAVMATVTPPSASPAILQSYAFDVSRSATLRLYHGGSSTTQAGRYSFHISGHSDYTEKSVSLEISSRCSVMINQD